MSDKNLIINSTASFMLAVKQITELYDEHKYVTLSYRLGEDRSLDQNALLHVWLTEYVAFILRKDKRDITPAEVAGIKRAAKKDFYTETGRDWMVHKIADPWNPSQQKTDFTSSKNWKVGEMFEFLTWLQARGVNDGIVLESKGQYKKLQEKSFGVEA